VAPVVAEPMDGARGVLQRKFDGRRASFGRHLILPCLEDSATQDAGSAGAESLRWTCPGLVDSYPLREEGGHHAQGTSTIFG
jgi:hypothetical protein